MIALIDLTNEEWRSIAGFEGLYEVSDLGRVRSLDTTINLVVNGTACIKTNKGRILKPAVRTGGYYLVTLSNQSGGKGIRKNASIHRLVAHAFLPNPDNLSTVNHKDGNKLNNQISNLEWASLSSNIRHAFSNGLNKSKNRYCSSFSKDDVLKIRELSSSGASIRHLSKMFNISDSHCWNILRGRSWNI